MKKFITLGLLTISLLVTTSLSLAEDIELYVSDAVKQSAKKSKVLIIFDNSGSMGTLHQVPEGFDSDPADGYDDYEPEGPSHAYNDDAIYFNKGSADGTSTIPDSPSDARRFLKEINGCKSSIDELEQYGFYTGHIREYRMKGNSGTWEEIPDNNGLNIEILDCEEDDVAYDAAGEIIAGSGNKWNVDGETGYPVNHLGTKKEPVTHTLDKEKLTGNKVTWSGSLVTLYTARYLRWYYGQSVDEVTETRLDTAIRSISNVIRLTDGVEFGLEVFNHNGGRNDKATDPNGGRVAFGINEMSTANQANLLDIINNELTASTWTPLCESVYEASQYFAGKPIEFGDDDNKLYDHSYQPNQPPTDTAIIAGNNNYIAPFNECSDKAYIILITDGEPTHDHGADNKIELMTSKVPNGEDAEGNPVFEEITFSGDRYTADGSNSYLPALAAWMYNYDINPYLDGIQTITTHTIGFSTGAADAEGLLRATAEASGGAEPARDDGKFFFAENEQDLTSALLGTLRNLTPSNDSLTSASVAANNFDRTETLNSVYYAMFDPQIGARWQGNLKKYKVIDGVQMGINNKPAINEESGLFSTEVLSYWSSVDAKGKTDGNQVAKGGVAEWFSTQEVLSRKVYSDIGDAGGLALLNAAALVGNEDKFANDLGIALEEVTDYFNWNLGMDVDDDDNDNSSTDMRQDVFGDPLHSKPLVINYGDGDIRLVIGTNAGALHMFKDAGEAVSEEWAFMPTELFPNIKDLRDNFSSADKVYGIDGQITSYVNDKDGDGIIEIGDTVWIFFGLRRGGSSYYALDISDKNNPKLMWHIVGGTTGFEELTQTWSQPKVGYSKLNVSGDVASPVLFFGGGYDTNKDSAGVGSVDSKGRSVYMVDAKTGSLKWSMTPAGGDLTFSGTDSIAASIGLLDSDGDGLVDRLYTGDTGGNVWRVDMPDETKSDFSVFKLADLGGNTNESDRRFFYEPSIVRTFIAETRTTEVTDVNGVTSEITVHQEVPYDAILIGSGDRSNPLGTDTLDSFFMIKDENIKTQTFTANSEPPTPSALTKSDLFDFTEDHFAKEMTTQERETLELAVSAKSGWFIDFTPTGEKNTAAGLAINGVAYFTSFTPPEFADELVDCKPPTGKGWLYGVDLALGTKIYDWRAENADNREDRIALISEQFLGSPTLIVLPDNPDDEKSDASGNLIVGRKLIGVNFSLKTMRTYLYITEE